jgi:hypothetical protein
VKQNGITIVVVMLDDLAKEDELVSVTGSKSPRPVKFLSRACLSAAGTATVIRRKRVEAKSPSESCLEASFPG